MAVKKAESKRGTKTASERAEEALATQTRVVERLGDRVQRAEHELERLESELAAAKTRWNYLAENPDLIVLGTPVTDAAVQASEPTDPTLEA